MLNDLAKKFEEEKNSKCSVCGGEVAHQCTQLVGSLLCDVALCNDPICNWIHNLKAHPSNKKLIQEYEEMLSPEQKIKGLEMELSFLKQTKTYYLEMREKNKDKSIIYTMFKDLVIGKDNEITTLSNKIKALEKQLKVAKYA